MHAADGLASEVARGMRSITGADVSDLSVIDSVIDWQLFGQLTGQEPFLGAIAPAAWWAVSQLLF